MSKNRNVTYAETGFLQVSVFAQDVGMPVEGANILVSPKGDASNILMDLITDCSGQTPTVDLPAPPAELSLNARTKERPYSEYDIVVQAEGFEASIIKGVQILPDSDALQSVYLSPIGSNSGTEIIHIGEHVLYGDYPQKIPEEVIKQLPPELGFTALPKPVIPQYMIVHAGKPSNAFAPNYWIPFKDYIKSVASSVLYDTWPGETIIANVLAIVSFALNRVYTQWYRSKGYEFTITNSTAYDQAFVYGRNTFGRISQIVDNVFSYYITKPAILQPLMAQYCDGRRGQYPDWMTQWGSKSLGDQGCSAMDILQSFYGDDIRLMEARVEDAPRSYPGMLREGAQGLDVRTIQTQLNAIADYFPAIPKVRADGVFSQATREAVQKFQMIFRLLSNGFVGSATWYKLWEIFAAVERVAKS